VCAACPCPHFFFSTLTSLLNSRGYTTFSYFGQPAIEPTLALPETLARNLRQGYFASVSHVDAQIGRLLQGLHALGEDGACVG
jgi:hypothetical protein